MTEKMLDRMDIRRTVSTIKKTASELMEGYLFELNDEKTRASLSGTVRQFLEHLKSKQAFYDYQVVCDETNNSPKTIDQGRLNMDLYLKPNKAINFLTLNFIASSSGTSFEDAGLQIEVKSELEEYLDRIGYEY
jgi:phage tail sheath protein FI